MKWLGAKNKGRFRIFVGDHVSPRRGNCDQSAIKSRLKVRKNANKKVDKIDILNSWGARNKGRFGIFVDDHDASRRGKCDQSVVKSRLKVRKNANQKVDKIDILNVWGPKIKGVSEYL